MKSLDETRCRWDVTFSNSANLSDLRAAVRSKSSVNPCAEGLRSAFLVFENLDHSTWPKTIRDSRSAYTSLKEHFLRDIDHPDDLSAADPLADDPNSPWNTLRRDEILRAEIFQDVERCMPDNLFFREPKTQSILLEVLFVFCKLNADVGYRQGMHEVLAPVLWVISRDAIDLRLENGDEKNTNRGNELLLSVLDGAYIEHDAFTVFCIIMQTAKTFYETASNSQSGGTPASANSPIIERSKRIHEIFLHRTDRELAEHLTAIDILPQIFVIRWIRLLFGREFPFEDVLSLWDVLFAEDPGLDLIDLVCVAMLLRIRWQLLEADYSSALTMLLRYPIPAAPHGPITLVEDAIYLRKNLNAAGGSHLISKYTGRAPTSEGLTQTPGSRRRSLHTPRTSADFGRTRSPLRSPFHSLSDSGGLEGIFQEAAKGVYKRSEKWGVSFRGAVQGLQQGNQSPRRSLSGIRWSLDEARAVSPNQVQLNSRIRALEDRNKELAKMLQDAMDELSQQAQIFEDNKSEAEANALTLTVAKLQFVHVYLENSTMPLVSEIAQPLAQDEATIQGQSNDEKDVPTKATGNDDLGPAVPPKSDPRKAIDATGSSISPTKTRPARRRPPNTPAAIKKSESDASQASQFQHPRPSLTQSSFSWMLGEDRSKSNFVSASPFPPEQMRTPEHSRASISARGRAGFLFGEEKAEGPKDKITEEEDEDGFTMGTLKGVPNT